MSVSRLRGKTPAIASPDDGLCRPVPPFWELEDLIAAGVESRLALQIMAARRTGPTLVGPAAQRREHAFQRAS